MCRAQPRTKRRTAATAVEVAFVLSVCMVLLLAIFEYRRFVMLWYMVEEAKREGSRVTCVGTVTMQNTDVQAVVKGYLNGLPVTPNFPNGSPYKADPSTGAFAAPFASAAFGDPIAMEVNCTYTPMLPGLSFLVDPVIINAKVVMRSEAD